jgi:hypothetical protein
MTVNISPSARAMGFWSAVLATVFSVTYVLGQLAEWLGWFGSQGGPESISTPVELVMLTPGQNDSNSAGDVVKKASDFERVSIKCSRSSENVVF